MRGKSFEDRNDFKKVLLNQKPEKIDIGAIFDGPPKENAKGGCHKALSKEFVLDLDISDYDDVRKCCQKTLMCKDCWPLMQAGMQVLDVALRQDFGFEHLLWVYSGRRGIHCWVCDERARLLTNDQRAGVVSFLSLNNKRDFPTRKFPNKELDPWLQRAFSLLLPHFETTCVLIQGFLSQDADLRQVLDLCPQVLKTQTRLEPRRDG